MPPKLEKISFTKMRSVFFVSIIVALSITVLYLIGPFFYPIFWAAIIAIMFYPFYNWLNGKIKMPSLNAFATVVVVVITIFLPLVLISSLIVNESFDIYNTFTENNVISPVNFDGISNKLNNSALQPLIQSLNGEWTKYAAGLSKTIAEFLLNSISSVTQNSLHFFFVLFLMFYTLYYFLKDGKRMLQRLMHLSPLGDEYETILYQRFTSTARSILKSSLIIGGAQGLIGALLFWFTGVSGAFVWGVVMMAASLIPALGTFIVWLPVGVAMLLFGHLWQGITILLVGALVISLIDNLLRPPLIGKDIQMHPLLVLFSTLGGLYIFGISGFIIGPIIAALYLAAMSMYDHYYKKELENN